MFYNIVVYGIVKKKHEVSTFRILQTRTTQEESMLNQPAGSADSYFPKNSSYLFPISQHHYFGTFVQAMSQAWLECHMSLPAALSGSVSCLILFIPHSHQLNLLPCLISYTSSPILFTLYLFPFLLYSQVLHKFHRKMELQGLILV